MLLDSMGGSCKSLLWDRRFECPEDTRYYRLMIAFNVVDRCWRISVPLFIDIFKFCLTSGGKHNTLLRGFFCKTCRFIWFDNSYASGCLLDQPMDMRL